MTPPDSSTPTFATLGVPDDLVDALSGQGIDAPFAIQTETIPAALDGNDVSGRAPTGSGKTLAFGVPVVANVERARPKRPRALILVPTRELAAQVARDLNWLGASRDVRVHAFYGGTRFEPQIKALRSGVDIAVACPGRLADLVNQGIIRLDGVDQVVIDEADRMADMGFLPEVKRLVDQTDAGRQVLLFSATLDGDVDALVRRYQHDPVVVDVTPEGATSDLNYHFWTVPHAKKVEVAAAVVQRVGPTVVFSRTRYGADRVAQQLARAGVQAVAIHGNRTQNQRERALRSFRSGQARALVATDVAARGIHVDDVTCVVHFDLPTDPKDFVHRSGRTGRAGATGEVVAFAMPDRRKDNNKLFRALKLDVDLTDPDIEALPVGPAPRPPRRDHDGERNERPGGRKPSGQRPKARSVDPRDTKPGRKKGTPNRPHHTHDDHLSRRSRSKAKPKPSSRADGDSSNDWYPGDPTPESRPRRARNQDGKYREDGQNRSGRSTKNRTRDDRDQDNWFGGGGHPNGDDRNRDDRNRRDRSPQGSPARSGDGPRGRQATRRPGWPDQTGPGNDDGRSRGGHAPGSGRPKPKGPKSKGPRTAGAKNPNNRPNRAKSGPGKSFGSKRKAKPAGHSHGGSNGPGRAPRGSGGGRPGTAR